MGTSKSQSDETVADPEDWVDRYGDEFYRFAKSRLRDVQAAEEVVQETFLAGIRHLSDYDGRGPQKAWLLTILKRKLVDQLRSRARRESRLSDNSEAFADLFESNGRWKPAALPRLDPQDHIERGELWKVIRTCLEQLPVGQADVFILYAMEDMESEEICKELQISASNLWVRLHRARLNLAKCVGSKWLDSERAQLEPRQVFHEQDNE